MRLPQPPKMSHHKASGQAVVYFREKCVYLGPWRSAVARAEYDRVVAEWLANGRRFLPQNEVYTIAELMADYLQHCLQYYRLPTGEMSPEVDNIRLALRPLRKLYGSEPAASFGPLALKAVREAMIQTNWCRNSINRSIGRIKGMFRWGVEQERIPSTVYHGLQAVTGLRAGRSEARESDPVKPVSEEHVYATLRLLSTTVAGMVKLQLLTGMRPGEVCTMRTGDIDRSGSIWVYRPEHHKTQHHGHRREIAIGPKAQMILGRFLKADPNEFCFSPVEAVRELRMIKRQNRKTPMTPSQLARAERAAERAEQRRQRRAPGERYDVASYRRAIARAAKLADAFAKGGRVVDNDERMVPDWHPHQLRHTAATMLRKEYGIEAARVVLGHRSAAVTQIYAEVDAKKAAEIMARVG